MALIAGAGLAAASAPASAQAPGCGPEIAQKASEEKLNLDTGAYLRSTCFDGGTIPFTIGQSDLGKDAKATLDKVIVWLLAHPERKVTLAGHADDPASDEYNLALGSRRANIVLTYMTAHGIAPARLSTISYGRFRPLPADGGRNRTGRVEIVLDK
jgi:peptidoglycan-associated lipoprotein